MIAIRIVKINRPDDWRVEGVLDGPAIRIIRLNKILFNLLEALDRYADTNSWTGAGRRSGSDAGEVKTDNIFSRKDISLTWTTIGIASGGFENQPRISM